MNNDAQLEKLQLEKLKTLCDELIKLDKNKQSHSELIEVLKINYKLSDDETNEITDKLVGKKKLNEEDQKYFDEIKKEFDKYCNVTDIDNDLEYKKIKSRIANRLSKLNKEK